MCMIGKDGQEVKDTFEFERAEDGTDIVTAKILFEKFEAYCKPRRNLVVDRHRFVTRDQQPDESIDQFVTELRTLAASCEWGELKDDLICSRIVSGISSNTVPEQLSGAKYFSTLDARSGFWQIPLDEESSLLTTFSTVFGRYRFTRLPFGIHSAQEVCHKRLHELLGDLPGVETDIDDILVWGRTQQPDDERLVNLLQRTRECNLKLNPDKSKIRQPEVLYIGHVLTGDGVRQDTSKIEAVTKMPRPEDKQGVQRLLGMVNYVAKFSRDISEVTALLRELLKKHVAWHWTECHEQSLVAIKKVLTETSPGVLRYYDPKKPVGLQVDACKSGLGAVLVQDGSQSRMLCDPSQRLSEDTLK